MLGFCIFCWTSFAIFFCNFCLYNGGVPLSLCWGILKGLTALTFFCYNRHSFNKIIWLSKTPGRSKCSPIRIRTKPTRQLLRYFMLLDRTITPLLHLGSRIIRQTLQTMFPQRLLSIAGSKIILQLIPRPIRRLGRRIILTLG